MELLTLIMNASRIPKTVTVLKRNLELICVSVKELLKRVIKQQSLLEVTRLSNKAESVKIPGSVIKPRLKDRC